MGVFLGWICLDTPPPPKKKNPYFVDEVILSDSIAGTMGCNFAFVNIRGNNIN